IWTRPAWAEGSRGLGRKTDGHPTGRRRACVTVLAAAELLYIRGSIARACLVGFGCVSADDSSTTAGCHPRTVTGVSRRPRSRDPQGSNLRTSECVVDLP